MRTLVASDEPERRPGDGPTFAVSMSGHTAALPTAFYPLVCPVTGLLHGCRCGRCRPDLHLAVLSTAANAVRTFWVSAVTTVADVATRIIYGDG